MATPDSEFKEIFLRKFSNDFRRKSLSGNWKTNVGDVEIKEVTVQERYKKWIDEASAMFGGLRLCSLEAIVDNSGPLTDFAK